MPGRGPEGVGSQQRAMVFCVVPHELAARLHEPLRRHFADDPHVEVVVEQRGASRRSEVERRATAAEPAMERRRIRGDGGRRVGERRSHTLTVEEAPPLPRRFGRYAERLVFVERLEPSTQHAEDLETARLVTRIQGGEDDAFGELYTRYFDRVYGYLRLVLESQHSAEDATQQVFMRVLRALPRYERRRQPFRAWLFTIVRNLAMTELQRQNRVAPMDPEQINRHRESPHPAEPLSVLDWITDPEVLMFVERLPLAQRQVLMLRFLGDLSDAEIAGVLDRSVDDVRMLKSRALRFLRDRLSALGRGARYTPPSRMGWRTRHATVIRARRWALRV